jgi:hypothetical protein
MLSNPWGANHEQLAALLQPDAPALRVVQGPPGCGKTKLIADILSERLPAGDSALATSTSRQAIDNLVEKLAASAPDLRTVVRGGARPRSLNLVRVLWILTIGAMYVRPMAAGCRSYCSRRRPQVLGNIKRFLDPESVKKNRQTQTPPVVEYKWLHKFHLESQIASDAGVVVAQSRLDQLRQEHNQLVSVLPPQRLSETAEAYLQRVNLQQARKRAATARLPALSPDLMELVCSHGCLQLFVPKVFERLAVRQAIAVLALDEARADAKEDILKACDVFVCTIGSVHYVARHAAAKNLSYIVVDEASRLCEMDVCRLLVASPALRNLDLVGDQQQLEPFSHSGSAAARSSLMQRFVHEAEFHMLQEQFRMVRLVSCTFAPHSVRHPPGSSNSPFTTQDPAICHLVSQFGYGGQLRTNAAVCPPISAAAGQRD